MKWLDQKAGRANDVSWLMLLSIGAVIIGSLCLLRSNVLYTDGEVMQGVFTLLVSLVAACVLVGIYRRKTAVWCVTLLGGSLLLWQSCQIQKWAVIHEEVLAIVKFAEDTKRNTGKYPMDLSGYVFRNPQVKRHIYAGGTNATNGFLLTYFMNNAGITYWYSSETGFGYYPD